MATGRPVDTPMTAAVMARGKGKGRRPAPVDEVAQAIVRGIDARKPVIYAPAIWWPIMTIVRNLPRFVFNRLDI